MPNRIATAADPLPVRLRRKGRRWHVVAPLQAAWLVLFATVALPAWAEDPGRPASPGAPTLGAQSLKAPLKLDQASLPIKNIPPLQRRDELDRGYDDFRQKYDATLAAIDRYERTEAACRIRTYSIDDQRNAGCRETDTIASCRLKLYQNCTRDAEMAQSIIWTQLGMSAATLRRKLLDFSNAPRPLR